jgi:serine/threonine protein kinase
VKHCHDNGIAHRDLKLENITIFGLKGKVKLIDFGFSIAINDKEKIDVDS